MNTAMTTLLHSLPRLLLCAFMAASVNSAWADDNTIRKNFAARQPTFPKIDEISKTKIPGIFELRVGTEIFYSDASGDHLIEGQLVDTKIGRASCRERV